jgi:hypothetical protein
VITVILVALAVFGVPMLYFAWRSTRIVQTPEVNGMRSITGFILFLICFYFGFIKKPKG